MDWVEREGRRAQILTKTTIALLFSSAAICTGGLDNGRSEEWSW